MSFTRRTVTVGVRAGGRPRRGRALVAAVAPVALLAGLFAAAPASAHHAPIGNATFPGSNVRCSSGQKTYLRAAWQEAYAYTKRAENLVDYIAAQPTEDDRRRLWEQDFRGYGDTSNWQLTSSPQRYFGAYDHARLTRVQHALEVARSRYEGKTMYLITCSTVCAKKKTTSAHHAVRGRIVTCSVFWSRARDTGTTYADRLARSAFTLTHETLHHVFVKVGKVWAALGDYHGDGVGGHTDQKYYGVANVTALAREKTNWAVRNNDSYAFFAQAVNRPAEEAFTGVYAEKEGTGTGGVFRDLTWGQLEAKKADLAAGGQYLADVETYIRGGQRLYAALWRIGAGDGLLTRAEEGPFMAHRKAIDREQDLIDVELYRDNGKWRYIGVFRKRAADAQGVGALQVDLSWPTLFARQSEYAKLGAYLADVETYVEGGTRKYLGLWRVGPGAGALANTADATLFTKILDDRRGSQQLIDVERYQEGGRVWQIGVWRHAAIGRGYAREPWNALVNRMLATAGTRTLIDIEEDSTVPMEY
jgi:hypothetical protein